MSTQSEDMKIRMEPFSIEDLINISLLGLKWLITTSIIITVTIATTITPNNNNININNHNDKKAAIIIK